MTTHIYVVQRHSDDFTEIIAAYSNARAAELAHAHWSQDSDDRTYYTWSEHYIQDRFDPITPDDPVVGAYEGGFIGAQA